MDSNKTRTKDDKVVHLNARKDIDSASDQAIEWLARLRAANVTTQEKGAFAEWLSASSQHQRAFDDAAALWHLSGELKVVVRKDKLHKDKLRKDKLRKEKYRTYSPFRPLAAAASFLVVCLAVLLQLHAPNFSTGKGEHRRVLLSDGSSAFLNTNSEIQVLYSSDSRNIELIRGEVWFDVKPDAQRPFQVRGDFATAQAIGTAFSVRDATEFTRISVTKGQVQVLATNTESQYVTGDNSNRTHLLNAEQASVVDFEQHNRICDRCQCGNCLAARPAYLSRCQPGGDSCRHEPLSTPDH